MAEQFVGDVTHWFGKIGVLAIEVAEGELSAGDTIHVVGHTSDFTHTIDSMQIDNEAVSSAGVGALVGIQVGERARVGDKVYRVVAD